MVRLIYLLSYVSVKIEKDFQVHEVSGLQQIPWDKPLYSGWAKTGIC